VAITFVGYSNTTYASRTNTTISNTLSAGSITNGDVMLIDLLTAANTEAPDPSTLSGWTQVGTAIDITQGSFNLEHRTYIKVASSESGSYTWTHSSASSQGTLTVWRGVDNTTPQDATATQNSGNSNTSTWTGLTTATNDAVIVATGADWGSASVNLSPPSGMTEIYDVAPLIYAAYQTITAAGATGNKTHTNNSAINNSEPFTARLVALRPASSGYTLTAATTSYAYTATAAGLSRGLPLVADASSFAYTGTAAGLLYGRDLVSAASSFAYTGTAAALLQTRLLDATSASYTYTATAAGVFRGIPLPADAASFAYTGTAATLLHGSAVVADPAAYTATGTAAGLLHNYVLDAGASSFAYTGTAATLTYQTVGAYTLSADGSSFAATGSDAGLLHGWVAGAAGGVYAVTGSAAGLLHGYLIGADTSAYTVTASDVNLTYVQIGAYTLNADAASYATTAENAALTYVPIQGPSGAPPLFGIGGPKGKSKKTKRDEEEEKERLIPPILPSKPAPEILKLVAEAISPKPVAPAQVVPQRTKPPVLTALPNDDDEVLQIMQLLAEMDDE
jgi:hypothetical protein